MNLYTTHSSNYKWNAQYNLEGRTHYVDDSTLKFHKSRILYSVATDGGLLFGLVESYSVDMNNTQRAFRPVIFDIDGNVLERPKLEAGFKTSKQARDAMWNAINSMDAVTITNEAIDRFEKNAKREADYMRETLQGVINAGKVAA